MILRRLGNKKKIAKEIQKYFPPHKIYIEPFFGAGGMFFNKPKAKYNIVNDLDSDVFNLFQVVMNEKEELEKAFYIMPIHSDLLKHWQENNENEPIKKALRFLTLKNLTLFGQGDIYRYGDRNLKDEFFKVIDFTFDKINNVQFTNYNFQDFFKKISFPSDLSKVFIYSDPPYLNMTDKRPYNGLLFTKEQSLLLFNTLEETKCKFAMSEFDHPFILEQAKQRNLNVIIIGERQNLKNRRTEILVTNYENNQKSLFE